ncbi:MAG TPA: TlyA family RNA methyltransferase [Rhizomicrobium sp.]|jgi:23S rRNA (cytidine1920-2'-O)/16S rRNA (cytidine1409-2'-O)-methyltransferase
MKPSSRADIFLVEHGYAKTRAEAQEAIEAGNVFDGGRRVIKSSQRLNETARIKYSPAHPFVSRGALKLAGALNHFDLSPHGLTALDLGASTGGFSEVLLARGARKVFAVDVGHDQLHSKIANDPRVTALEGINARDLSPKQIAAAPQAIVVDVSFISLKIALPAALSLAAKGAWLVALVKPQFEVGKKFVGKGGIVKDADARIRALVDIGFWLQREQGWRLYGFIDSPVTGGDGNHEFFVAADKP